MAQAGLMRPLEPPARPPSARSITATVTRAPSTDARQAEPLAPGTAGREAPTAPLAKPPLDPRGGAAMH